MFEPHKKDASKIINSRQEIERKKQRKNRLQKQKAGIESAKRRAEKKLEGQQGKTEGVTAVEQPFNGNPTFLSPNSSKDSSKEESSKEERPPKATAKKGTRLADTFFLTPEMRSWAAERKPDVDLALETEKFCNYFRSAPGAKGIKLDWLLTWKNWILNARGTNGSNRQNINKSTSTERLAEYRSVLDQYPTEAELGHIA